MSGPRAVRIARENDAATRGRTMIKARETPKGDIVESIGPGPMVHGRSVTQLEPLL